MTAWIRRSAAGVSIVFGIATLVAGGRALFGPADVREALGVILSPLLWFNFLMGFAYVTAGVGILLRRRWGPALAWAIAVANSVAVLAVYGYWFGGNAVEPRTLGAVLLRAVVWAGIAWLARVGRRPDSSSPERA